MKVAEYEGSVVYHFDNESEFGMLCGYYGSTPSIVADAPSPERKLCVNCEKRQRSRRSDGNHE